MECATELAALTTLQVPQDENDAKSLDSLSGNFP